MAVNPYFLRARLFPTVLTSIPLLVVINAVIAPIYHEALKNIYAVLPTIASFGLSAAVIFLFVQINRLIAKEVFQRFFFQDEVRMPSTNHLLWQDSFFEDQIKVQIRTKIKDRFNIDLLDKRGEAQNEMKGRRLIVTAVSQIRNVLRGNKMLLQHNIEYGFFRNLIGGSLLAVAVSIFLLVYALIMDANRLCTTAIILIIVYLIPLLLSKMLIKKYGNYYSKILYEQFLTI